MCRAGWSAALPTAQMGTLSSGVPSFLQSLVMTVLFPATALAGESHPTSPRVSRLPGVPLCQQQPLGECGKLRPDLLVSPWTQG